jgi:hypothetical protein
LKPHPNPLFARNKAAVHCFVAVTSSVKSSINKSSFELEKPHMKYFFFTLICSLFFGNLYACETGEIAFEKNNLCAKIQWITGPSVNQYNSATIALSGPTAYKLNVLPWMVMDAGHEHGSRPVTITTVSPTDYLVEKMYFMEMMGDWYLKLQLVDAQKVVVEEVRTLVTF